MLPCAGLIVFCLFSSNHKGSETTNLHSHRCRILCVLSVSFSPLKPAKNEKNARISKKIQAVLHSFITAVKFSN